MAAPPMLAERGRDALYLLRPLISGASARRSWARNLQARPPDARFGASLSPPQLEGVKIGSMGTAPGRPRRAHGIPSGGIPTLEAALWLPLGLPATDAPCLRWNRLEQRYVRKFSGWQAFSVD